MRACISIFYVCKFWRSLCNTSSKHKNKANKKHQKHKEQSQVQLGGKGSARALAVCKVRPQHTHPHVILMHQSHQEVIAAALCGFWLICVVINAINLDCTWMSPSHPNTWALLHPVLHSFFLVPGALCWLPLGMTLHFALSSDVVIAILCQHFFSWLWESTLVTPSARLGRGAYHLCNQSCKTPCIWQRRITHCCVLLAGCDSSCKAAVATR